ncbi:unnamed protein product, partial [Rotaria sp. Silwood1]
MPMNASCIFQRAKTRKFFWSYLSKYEQWATEKWPKVRGVFTDIDSICDSLRQAARECDDDDMKITGQIEPSFMYSMLFKEIVLEIHFDLSIRNY